MENKECITEREKLAREIIDAVLDNAERLNFAWHYGEESMLVSDVVDIINNVADTDYKRIGHGFMKYSEKKPITIDEKCHLCLQNFRRFDKHEHREHCAGETHACDKFKSAVD